MDHTAPLRQLFASLADHRFLLVRPGGNWGDHLIYLGAEYLATQLGIRWKTAELEDLEAGTNIKPDMVIFIHGGGGYTQTASGRAARCLAAALRIPGVTVIQGPCTVDSVRDIDVLSEPFASASAASFTFIARERRTAEIVAPYLPSNVPLLLNVDSAFYMPRHLLWDRAGFVFRRMTLLAVREDPEAIAVSGSADFRGVILDPARYAASFDHWVRIHAAARRIVTNRTHSAICGAILGIPTIMFAGAYHKNRSIWEFSLRSRDVQWLDSHNRVPCRPEVDPLLRWAPALVQKSWKMNRLAYRLRGVPDA